GPAGGKVVAVPVLDPDLAARPGDEALAGEFHLLVHRRPRSHARVGARHAASRASSGLRLTMRRTALRETCTTACSLENCSAICAISRGESVSLSCRWRSTALAYAASSLAWRAAAARGSSGTRYFEVV